MTKISHILWDVITTKAFTVIEFRDENKFFTKTSTEENIVCNHLIQSLIDDTSFSISKSILSSFVSSRSSVVKDSSESWWISDILANSSETSLTELLYWLNIDSIFFLTFQINTILSVLFLIIDSYLFWKKIP